MRYRILMLVVVLLCASLLLAAGCGSSGGGSDQADDAMKKQADLRTCESNQRTVDGAIMTYYATTEQYPSTLEVLAEPGENQVLKKVPTCPSGGKYTLDTSVTPPIMSCSVHPYYGKK